MATIKVPPVRPNRTLENQYDDLIRSDVLEPLFFRTVRNLERAESNLRGVEASIQKAFDDMAPELSGASEATAKKAMAGIRKFYLEKESPKIGRLFGTDIKPFSSLEIRGLMQVKVDENIQLIKSIPDQLQDQLRDHLAETFHKKGFDREALTKTLVERFDVSASRARFIARDQTAKAMGDLNQARQLQLGIREYEWDDAGDGVVRDDHHAMHGRICRWDNAGVYKDRTTGLWKPRSNIGGVLLHPGQDFNCRCVGIGVVTI